MTAQTIVVAASFFFNLLGFWYLVRRSKRGTCLFCGRDASVLTTLHCGDKELQVTNLTVETMHVHPRARPPLEQPINSFEQE
jgi:hypothetical protein